MSVLTLQLAGPLQSWGACSRFARRTTEHAPTKSGVIGLLAAAQGRQRTDDLSDLAALRFGVRVDQRGTRLRDYQTARHFDSGKSMPVSERYYLADAVFVAALAGDDDLIHDLHRAVRQPVYLPYLGRRSCPPARPLDIGVRSGNDLRQALAAEPWRAADWYQHRQRHHRTAHLEVLLEADPGDPAGDSIRDQPLSFDPQHRRYALRSVVTFTADVPNPRAAPVPHARRSAPADHDPTAALGGD